MPCGQSGADPGRCYPEDVVVTDPIIARQILKLHDQLDDYPDTVNVFTNFEVADEILDQLDS